MKTILLLGVGRSTHTLIKYLVQHSDELNIKIILADKNLNNFIKNYINNNKCSFVVLDINDLISRDKLIQQADIVISMLPPAFHVLVAQSCINFKKNLITASYVSEDVRKLDASAKKANILILNEIGLDPGIDHISAMQVIDALNREGAKIKSFKSFCGGLIAPESDDNPWNYKFTWNPKNVILAGSSGASYLKDGKIKKLNYKEVFSHLEKVTIPEYGDFESYANRDSIHYKEKYNLVDATTIVRGTLRKVGFSSAWDVFVQLGMTLDEPSSNIVDKKTFDNYIQKLNKSDIKNKMDYLELYSDLNKAVTYKSPFDYLMQVLQKKWVLDKEDIDMIVMQHKFSYTLNNISKDMKLSMVVKGDDNIQTAMAKTVGLPIFYACKLLLAKKINLKGVRIPIYSEIYKPILKDLSNEGINFIQS